MDLAEEMYSERLVKGRRLQYAYIGFIKTTSTLIYLVQPVDWVHCVVINSYFVFPLKGDLNPRPMLKALRIEPLNFVHVNAAGGRFV